MPFDPRLIIKIAPAVAKAAMDSGVATRPISDMDLYAQQLTEFVYHSGLLMKPVFSAAKAAQQKNRIVLAEGEDERVLRATQVIVDERLARPILVGRPAVIERRLERFGLRLKPGADFDLINPENDPLGAGYHITQSKIAIGSGGIFGKGFLNGTQSHLDYLPEGHTDFVFATMAEEWGLVGGMVILFGFFLLFRWGLAVSIRANSRFAKLTAAGLTTTIFFYVAINLMMVMGLAPVVGIPLPFLSHGGSSMMTIMICVGILMSIDRNPGKRGGAFG